MLLHFFNEKSSVEFNGLPDGICTQPKSKFKYILQKKLMQVLVEEDTHVDTPALIEIFCRC